MRAIKKGAADQTIYVEILDSASTTGGRKTGIVYNSAGLTAYYARNGGSATAITLVTLAAANSAHSDGGFKEVDATNMPGVYRLDLPDAAVASGAESLVVTVKGASGAAQVSSEIQLVDNIDKDTYDIVNSGTHGNAALKTLIDTVDNFLDTEIAAILAAVDTEIASIKTQTDLIPGTGDGKTFAEKITLMAAVLLGKASGLATTTAVYRAVDDSKDRVTATVDASGNRSALTLDAG